jgi:methylated-DNA-protein-cysteine methyltransferase-like protein
MACRSAASASAWVAFGGTSSFSTVYSASPTRNDCFVMHRVHRNAHASRDLAQHREPSRTPRVSVRLLDAGSPSCQHREPNMRTSDSDSEHLRELFRRMHAVIRKIPRGRVATYGQVAELAGLPGGARVAAASLKASKPGDRLPWQRVIGKAGKLRGRIAIHDPVGAAVQRQLLEREGVTIGDSGLIPLDVFGWLPTTGESGRVASPRRPPRSGSKRRASSSRR